MNSVGMGSTTVGASSVDGSPMNALASLLASAKENLKQKIVAISAQGATSGIDYKLAAQQFVASMAVSTSLLLGEGNPMAQQNQQVLHPDLGQSVNMAAPMNEPTPQPSNGTLSATMSAEDARLTVAVTAEEHQEILQKVAEYTTRAPGQFEHQDELYIEQQLSDMLGFSVTAELDNHRLNHSIGVMGGEQHLKRHPTDTLEAHDAYQESGIAPNRGAFGWFTEQGKLTEKAVEREKYYFAVQTMYLPDWNTKHDELKPWYQFRKMIVINPHDQTAVVGVVGDAGPAQWVQKQFGGSPEVIREGKIWSKAARGRVMLLFVDDPKDEIPLGPIDLSFSSRYNVQASTVLEESRL
jgi:hypothetical protein